MIGGVCCNGDLQHGLALDQRLGFMRMGEAATCGGIEIDRSTVEWVENVAYLHVNVRRGFTPRNATCSSSRADTIVHVEKTLQFSFGDTVDRGRVDESWVIITICDDGDQREIVVADVLLLIDT